MEEHASPSGRYKLVVVNRPTKPGCWDYTTGTVTRDGHSDPVAIVDRNYSSFPFLWVEGHPNGHDYLVCGSNYQGQTVIELDTGRRRDFLPNAAHDGCGFCWASYTFNHEHKMLVVEGCVWACPYEYRFYDFSDPMEKGWPEIEVEDQAIDADGKAPTFNPDGTLTCWEVRLIPNDDEDADDSYNREVVGSTTFRRVDLRLVKVDRWLDEAERLRREEAKAKHEEWERMWEDFKKSDPLFLLVKESPKTHGFRSDGWVSLGVTYEGWCPHFTGKEGRVCRSLSHSGSKPSIEVEWGRETAPIKIVVYQGDTVRNKWFDRSLDGMREALDFAKQVMEGKVTIEAVA